MLGISIYLSKEHIEKNLQLIQSAKANGFQSIFT
ncbi:MupG family TIM beta-alpha barrel fold protein, partial [Pseudomonas sp. FW305-BF6]